MAATKTKSKDEREEVLQRIAELNRRGLNQYQIAKELKVSQPMISNDLKIIRARYRDAQLLETDALIQEKLEQYADIRRIAWEAYYRSIEDKEKVVEEYARPKPLEVDGKKGGVTKKDRKKEDDSIERLRRIVTTEGRLPANEYLNTIMETLKAERELMGLDKAKKVDVGGSIGVMLPWEELFTRNASDDPVEKKIAEIEMKVMPKGTVNPQALVVHTGEQK